MSRTEHGSFPVLLIDACSGASTIGARSLLTPYVSYARPGFATSNDTLLRLAVFSRSKVYKSPSLQCVVSFLHSRRRDKQHNHKTRHNQRRSNKTHKQNGASRSRKLASYDIMLAFEVPMEAEEEDEDSCIPPSADTL